MEQHTDTPDTTVEDRNTRKPGKRLAFENAYRIQKKALISEIAHSLGFDPGNTVPTTPVT